eukprot:5600326-Pyramimonas_sp.AAC.1
MTPCAQTVTRDLVHHICVLPTGFVYLHNKKRPPHLPRIPTGSQGSSHFDCPARLVRAPGGPPRTPVARRPAMAEGGGAGPAAAAGA